MTNYSEMAKKAKEAGNARVLTPKYMEWKKKGQVIAGAFVSKAAVTSSTGQGSYNQYVFDTDDGPVKFHMGSATDAEIAAQLVPGVIYAVEYLGKEDIPGGRSVNKFNVMELGPSAAYSVEPV